MRVLALCAACGEPLCACPDPLWSGAIPVPGRQHSTIDLRAQPAPEADAAPLLPLGAASANDRSRFHAEGCAR